MSINEITALAGAGSAIVSGTADIAGYHGHVAKEGRNNPHLHLSPESLATHGRARGVAHIAKAGHVFSALVVLGILARDLYAQKQLAKARLVVLGGFTLSAIPVIRRSSEASFESRFPCQRLAEDLAIHTAQLVVGTGFTLYATWKMRNGNNKALPSLLVGSTVIAQLAALLTPKQYQTFSHPGTGRVSV